MWMVIWSWLIAVFGAVAVRGVGFWRIVGGELALLFLLSGWTSLWIFWVYLGLFLVF